MLEYLDIANQASERIYNAMSARRIGRITQEPLNEKSRIGPSRKSIVRWSRRYQEARPLTLIRGVSRRPASTRAPRSS